MAAPLPDWLEPLPDAERMRADDAWAIEQQGMPSLDLMERAGAGLARLTAELAPEGPVAVVCGKGNNGGDGLVAARLLREQDREVRVLLTGAAEELRGDPAANLERLTGDGPEPFAPDSLTGAAAVVDALLGTGCSGEPRDPIRGAIEAINGSGAVVAAADVPSGVDASNGVVAGAAVRADGTATFHAAKPGLWIAPGKEHAGQVRVIEIGIPPGAPAIADVGLVQPQALGQIPRREPNSTKFREGAVLVVGGSAGLTGAPSLASEAAARAGAGYVTAAVPRSLSLVFELRLLDRPAAEIEAERLRHARAAADASGAIVVLKGDDSLVAEPAGRVAVSPGGAPALATAGTGDVLSGTIGALLAKGMPAFDAACAGVALHAEAGRRAAGVHGPDAVIASDVIASLPAARER